MFNPPVPNMSTTVKAWSKMTDVFIVGKRLENFKTVESLYLNRVNLFRNPTGQKLEMKPEGQRRWNTETVFTDNSLNLKVDDIIIFDCETNDRYRVISKTDYSQFGFIEYNIISDYKS